MKDRYVVTGGPSGVGASLVERLARRGLEIRVLDVKPPGPEAQTGRIAEPADIAAVIDLLLTGECSWLNGVDVPVDGGYSAGIESGRIDCADSPLMRRIRKART